MKARKRKHIKMTSKELKMFIRQSLETFMEMNLTDDLTPSNIH